VYENREPLQVVPEYTNVSELAVPKKDMRRKSVDDMYNKYSDGGSVNGVGQGISNKKYSNDVTYQNMPKPVSGTISEVVSPTKKSHCTTINVPVPDGYYNFPPPSLLTKSSSKNCFPSSSPDDDRVSIQEIQASLRSPTRTVPFPSASNQADRYSPEIAMDAVGDKAAQRSRQYSPNFDQVDGTYQNLEFMRGTNGDATKR